VLGGHGSVSPAGVTSVAYGATPTCLFTPDAGYRVDAVTVDGLAVAMTATNACTFPGVAASHALTVSFAPIAPVPAAGVKPFQHDDPDPGEPPFGDDPAAASARACTTRPATRRPASLFGGRAP